MRVFVSYRRSDSAPYAGRLTDTLVRRFGEGNVFHDVTAVAPGRDFVDAVDRALSSSDALLAVIGPGWSTASGPTGQRRLDDPHDHVRLELVTALRRGARVVPVLVGGAVLPAAEDLPDDLRGLRNRQAVALHDETWVDDVDGLLRALGHETAPARRRPPWMIGAALVAALVVGGGLAWWALPSGGASVSGGGSPTSDGASPATAYQPPPRCDSPEGTGWTPMALAARPSGTDPRPNGSIGFTVTDARWRPDGQRFEVLLAVRTDNATADYITLGDWLYPDLVVGRRPWSLTCLSLTRTTVAPGQAGDVRVGYEVGCVPNGFVELEIEQGRLPVTDGAGSAALCSSV